MVNMYSMGSMGMNNNSYGMNNSNQSGNIPNNFKAKYGNGYEDFGVRPYAQPYPFAITPRCPQTFKDDSLLIRILKTFCI